MAKAPVALTKDALLRWEANGGDNGETRQTAEVVKLIGQIPPIEKMDASLNALHNCKQLSLSTNAIEKIANLNALKFLKILSLGRNNLKTLSGIEAVADTLEQLWISNNFIEKLKGIQRMQQLTTLYISCNLVKEMSEINRLIELPRLTDLNVIGNPIEEKAADKDEFRKDLQKKIRTLHRIDGIAYVKEDDE